MCRQFFLVGKRQFVNGTAVAKGRSGHFRRPKACGGFTLVELLVVVAIIALLVSILLPSLNRAKEQARTVVCMTNYKSLDLALTYYIDETNGWYPQGCGIGGDPPTWDFVLRPYYESCEVLGCPSDRLERASWYEARGIPEDSRFPRSYAISRAVTWMGPSEWGDLNGYPSYWPGGVGRPKWIEDASETIIIGEQWKATYWQSAGTRPGMYGQYHGSGIFTLWETNWFGRGPTLDVHYNNEAANYLFCDGHVDRVKADDRNLDETNDYYYWRREK